MALEEYLVPYGARTNICFDCQRACGGCSWSACHTVTGKPLFLPVPGWTAKPSKIYSEPKGHKRDVDLSHHRLTAVSSRRCGREENVKNEVRIC